MSLKRETLSSRLGFIFLSAGCAIGLGNVWRFPYITGRYGGAAFILMYLFFLAIFGMPIMVMEFAVGRASKKSVVAAFRDLEPQNGKWGIFGYAAMAGNYILMMFYTVCTGWMLHYFASSAMGKLSGLDAAQIEGYFGAMLSSPKTLVSWMLVAIALGFTVCGFGLQNGVEKVSKVLMTGLFALVLILAVRVAFLPNAAKGYEFFLKPNLANIRQNLGEAVYAAMGQAFFTLSIGMGALTIFGSYIEKSRKLAGESLNVIILDTVIAILAGLIIFPAAFSFGIEPGAGPGLLFITLPNVFSKMSLGSLWSALFFLFMSFAALTTVIAVFENLVACLIDGFGFSRKKAVALNIVLISVLSLPCALGFNVLSGFQPLGAGSCVLDLEDFIVSNNILPLGSMVFLFFCCLNRGWGWRNFLAEANSGEGIGIPASKAYRIYISVVLPLIVAVVFVMGYVQMFAK